MTDLLLHRLPAGAEMHEAPARFTYPFAYTPHPWARLAAEEMFAHVKQYMVEHSESELHRRGKMFGVLVVRTSEDTAVYAPDNVGYLAAFSAMLDGTYEHEGFVPPVVDISIPDGYFRQEEACISGMPLGAERKLRSQALQRWLFAEYKMLNGVGETKNLLDIFANEPKIWSEEEFFEGKGVKEDGKEDKRKENVPPAGAGECCAPKLLQYALLHGMKPLCMAEFWVGASPQTEVREEGRYYPSCSGKCKPILRHMLQGFEVDDDPLKQDEERLLGQIRSIYEDEWIKVVDKPTGVRSEVVASRLSDSEKEYLLVHRLDQDTSGLLVMAKTPDVHKALQKQFLRRDIKKRYEAVLERSPKGMEQKQAGTIDLPLLPNPMDRPRQMVNMEHGKPSVTEYSVREIREDGTCLVDFFPLTGRTHQLRVHAAHPLGLASPILGDRLYGTPGERLMLHAAELTLEHPVTRQPLHFCISSPFNG